MKNLWIALVLMLTVSACLPDKKSKEDPEPDLSGTYTVSRFIDQGVDYDLPATINGRRVSAVVVVSRPNDTQIRFRINVNNDGTVNNGDEADVTIQKEAGREYTLIEGGNRIGSIDGTNFSIDFIQAGKRSAIIARK